MFEYKTNFSRQVGFNTFLVSKKRNKKKNKVLLPDPSVKHPHGSFAEEFSIIHNRLLKQREGKFEPSPHQFNNFNYVPPTPDKPFAGLVPDTKSKNAKEWMEFWIPQYLAHFGYDFQQVMQYYFVNTLSGQKVAAKHWQDINNIAPEDPSQMSTVSEVKKMFKPEEQAEWHQVLYNKDLARISMRQIIKLTRGKIKINGMSGDTISRLTNLWPPFMEKHGLQWSVGEDNGHVVMDRIFDSWITQILDEIKEKPHLEDVYKLENDTLICRGVWDTRNLRACPLGAFLVPIHKLFKEQLWSTAFLVEARKCGESLEELQTLEYYKSLLLQINNGTYRRQVSKD